MILYCNVVGYFVYMYCVSNDGIIYHLEKAQNLMKADGFTAQYLSCLLAIQPDVRPVDSGLE